MTEPQSAKLQISEEKAKAEEEEPKPLKEDKLGQGVDNGDLGKVLNTKHLPLSPILSESSNILSSSE